MFASLARTCLAFQQIALNILYRDLEESISPIIRSLSRDLWKRTPLSSPVYAHKLVGVFSCSDPAMISDSMVKRHSRDR